MEIKKILQSQIADMIDLVSNVFLKFEAPDYTEEGIKAFFDTALNNADFINSLDIYGAFKSDRLVGTIATRNKGAHIALLFVDEAFHQQGIGKQLFNAVLQIGTLNEITVNSSPYAKEFYHRLGFQDTNVEQTVTGIRFIPMVYIKRA